MKLTNDFIYWALPALIGLVFALVIIQNMILSKKLAFISLQNDQIIRVLYEGSCD